MARHGGAKLATRVANTVVKAIVATHAKLTGHKHDLAMSIFHSISDVISQEVHQTIGDTLRDMHEKLPDDSPAKSVLAFMGYEIGQLQAGVGLALNVSGLFGSIATIMNNELLPIVYNAVASNPHSIPDPGTISELVAKGLMANGNGIGAMGQNGFNDEWAQLMIDAGYSYPSMSDAFDMVRRGLIGTDVAVEWAVKNGTPEDVALQWINLIGAPLSPADAALALLRGNMDEGSAQKAAAAWGINENDFNVIVNNTGEPLGLEQLLEAYRRGFIDQGTLEQGILQSRVRNEWIPTALQLAYSPMSVSDAVNAVVQNQLDEGTADSYAQMNGLMPGMFNILLNTAGEPLSRTEMEDLYNRGEVTEEQVNQALSESRLKNKYNDLAFKLHEKLLNPSTISDAVLYGSLDENAAVGMTMKLGYSQDNAAVMVLAASNAKMLAYRTRVVEDIASMYEVNAIDQTTATQYITDMGFSSDQAAVILQAAEFNREKRAMEAATNAVRSKFIGHHITSDDANTLLQDIGVPSGQITYLMNLWEIEQSANVKLLTEAQVIKAMNLGLMDQPTALAYLESLGYAESDATMLINGA